LTTPTQDLQERWTCIFYVHLR